MEESFSVGIIGAGRIGKIHIENLLYRIPNINLKYIVDNQIDEKMKKWAQEIGVSNLIDDPKIIGKIANFAINRGYQNDMLRFFYGISLLESGQWEECYPYLADTSDKTLLTLDITKNEMTSVLETIKESINRSKI